MQVSSIHFKATAAKKLHEPVLQKSLERFSERFVDARARAIAELDNFEDDSRRRARQIRDRALANLDVYLERFERKAATARGAVVHWAETRGGRKPDRVSKSLASTA